MRSMSCGSAHRRGARFLYISATPSRRAIDFFLRLGAAVAAAPAPELFQLEPEDNHLACSAQGGA